MALSPDQFRESTSKDSHTGRSHVYAEVAVSDRQPHEPHDVRTSAQEFGKNSWLVKTVHGPHDTKDESGSYYKTVSEGRHEGTVSSAKSHVRKAAKQAYKDMKGQR